MTDPAWIETQSAFIVCADSRTLTHTEYKEGIAILYHILTTEFSCTGMSVGYYFCTQRVKVKRQASIHIKGFIFILLAK